MAKTQKASAGTADVRGATPIAFAGIGAALAAGLGVAAAGLSIAFACALAGAIGGAILGVWLDRR
jgi:membrane associated rhomboid family serine protease